jgi:hypothetical protein
MGFGLGVDPNEVIAHVEAPPGSAQVEAVVAVVPDRPHHTLEQLLILRTFETIFMGMIRHALGEDPPDRGHPSLQLCISEVRWLHARAAATPDRVVGSAYLPALRVDDLLTQEHPATVASATAAPLCEGYAPEDEAAEAVFAAYAPPVSIRTAAGVRGRIHAIDDASRAGRAHQEEPTAIGSDPHLDGPLARGEASWRSRRWLALSRREERCGRAALIRSISVSMLSARSARRSAFFDARAS